MQGGSRYEHIREARHCLGGSAAGKAAGQAVRIPRVRPPPGRAEIEATIADLEGQIAGSTKPKPVEAGGVPASLRPRGEGRSPSSEQIAIHAYHLWLAQGRPVGTDWDDWLEAERRLAASA